MIKKQFTCQLPPKLLEDFKTYLPYCAEEIIDFIALCDGRLRVDYTCKGEASIPSIEKAIRNLAEALCGTREPDPVEMKVVFDNRPAACIPKEIDDELLKEGHLLRFGEGQYGMSKTFLTVFKYFERACHRLAMQQNPEECVYPIMIPTGYLNQCDIIDARSTTFFSAGGGQPRHAGKMAVCLHCYPHFENKAITRPVTITTQGRCYRYEPAAAGASQLMNLWEFIMRESIYLGSPAFVRERLEDMRRRTESWILRLGLPCWIETANDLFFAVNPDVLGMTRLVKESKYELRISAAKTSLALASFNFHGPHFGKAFNITYGKNPVATGCAKFGMERLTYAFLSHYGLQPEQWPQAIQEEIKAS